MKTLFANLLLLAMVLFGTVAHAGEKDLALFNVIKEIGAPTQSRSAHDEIGLGKVDCGVYASSSGPAYYCGSNELFHGGKDEIKDFNPEFERAQHLYEALMAHGVLPVGDKLQSVETVKCVQAKEGSGTLEDRTHCELSVSKVETSQLLTSN